MTKPKPKKAAVAPATDLRDTIVAIARRFVGVHERGHNAGPEVKLFQRWAGGAASAARHDAWCAAFCDYVYEHACAQCHALPLLNIGLSVRRLVQRARERGLLYTDPARVQPGDLWVWKHGLRYRHVEVITGPPRAAIPADRVPTAGLVVPTIGGNTSRGRGSVNEGDGVYERIRPCAGNVFVRVA
jgi:hypothetical protein